MSTQKESAGQEQPARAKISKEIADRAKEQMASREKQIRENQNDVKK